MLRRVVTLPGHPINAGNMPRRHLPYVTGITLLVKNGWVRRPCDGGTVGLMFGAETYAQCVPVHQPGMCRMVFSVPEIDTGGER